MCNYRFCYIFRLNIIVILHNIVQDIFTYLFNNLKAAMGKSINCGLFSFFGFIPNIVLCE